MQSSGSTTQLIKSRLRKTKPNSATMTIKTNFDLVIEQETNHPHLIDAQHATFEFARLDLLDDNSTVSSYSDDDSTLDSLGSDCGLEIPLTGGRGRSHRGRNLSRQALEQMLAELDREESMLGRRGPHRADSNEDSDHDSVNLTIRRGIRLLRDRSDDMEEDDSLRLAGSRVPRRAHMTMIEQMEEDDLDEEEDDYEADIYIPLSPMVGCSPTVSRKVLDRTRSF
jgi:hypothetical protein